MIIQILLIQYKHRFPIQAGAEVRKFLPFIHQREFSGKNHDKYDPKEVFSPDKFTVPLSVFIRCTLQYAQH